MSDNLIIAIVVTTFLLLLVAVVAFFVWFVFRSKRETRERHEAIADLLTERGITARAGQPFPSDLPSLPLVKKRGRPKFAIRAESNGVTLWVFELFDGNRAPTGRNIEVRSSGGESGGPSFYSRHTIACVHKVDLALPEFEILPNLAESLHEAVAAAGVDEASWQGKLVTGLVRMAENLGESRTPVRLNDREEFCSAYNVFTEDPQAAADILDESITEFLLAEPGLIVCGRGQWLLLSRNVRVLPGGVPEGIDLGYLHPPQAAELAEMSLDLSERLV